MKGFQFHETHLVKALNQITPYLFKIVEDGCVVAEWARAPKVDGD